MRRCAFIEGHGQTGPRIARIYRTYRCILWRKCALRHVVLPESQSLRGARRKLVRSLLWHEQSLALFSAGYVPTQEREELVPQHGLDPLEGVRRVPAIAFLDMRYLARHRICTGNRPTLQTSRRSSSSSIISFSIGSVISHSWKAAVSFVTVTPSNICDLFEELLSI